MHPQHYSILEEQSGQRLRMRSLKKNRLFHLMLIILVFGVILTILNIYELHSMKADHQFHHEELKRLPEVEAMSMDQTRPIDNRPVVWIQGSGSSKAHNDHGRSSYLKHVFLVFEKLGFTFGREKSDWIVMWSHDYPFVTFADTMKTLKPHQRVNHFPGSGYITNKVTLAQTNLDFIPKAFEMPLKKEEFVKYAEQHKNLSWVQKSNRHRGIEVKDRYSLDLSKKGSFIQRFVSNPFLIDGHKFDIGIYTIITGIDPLRVYVIDGDALFRFCPEVYYPFDDSILDKYVVGDDYLPMWNLPSLKDIFTNKGFTFRDSFNEYLREKGRDALSVWNKMKTAIKQAVLSKEKDLIKSSKNFPSKRNFFEMVRFDFVIDEEFNVFMMEANMSPNLSSEHFPENAELYNHVIFNMLGLVGFHHIMPGSNHENTAMYDDSIVVPSKHIQVFPDYCKSDICMGSCKRLHCKLCKKCLSSSLEIDIKIAYLEHTHRGSSRRVFPPPMSQTEALKWRPDSYLLDGLNEKNKLIYLWFIGKCRLDSGWCQ